MSLLILPESSSEILISTFYKGFYLFVSYALQNLD